MLKTAARIALPLYIGAIYATLGVARTLTEQIRAAGQLRLTVAILFALAGAALLALILRDPRSRNLRTLAALALAGAAYAAAILPMESPEEKLHFVQYGLVALLADAAAPERFSARARFAFAAVLTALAGWGDELIQALLPSRYYDLRDVGFNAAAGLFALAALAAVRWARATASSSSSSALASPPRKPA